MTSEPGAVPVFRLISYQSQVGTLAILISPRWGLPGAGLAWGGACLGGAPGFINIAPLGLDSTLDYFR